MIPRSFEYSAPGTLDEAVSLLKQLGPDAKILSGGQSLIPMMKLRLASPPHIVDINGIDIQADGGTHVASTAMIGRIAVTKMESKGRGFRRLRIRIEDPE